MEQVRFLRNVRRMWGLVLALVLGSVVAGLLITHLTLASAVPAPFPPLAERSERPTPAIAQAGAEAAKPSGPTALVATATPLPSNVKLEQWETIPTGNWITATLAPATPTITKERSSHSGWT